LVTGYFVVKKKQTNITCMKLGFEVILVSNNTINIYTECFTACVMLLISDKLIIRKPCLLDNALLIFNCYLSHKYG